MVGLGALEGASQLAEHLGLAGDCRAEPRGDGEEVRGDAAVEVDGDERRELGRLDDAACSARTEVIPSTAPWNRSITA